MWKCEEILGIFLIQLNSWHFLKSYDRFYLKIGILQGSQNSFKKIKKYRYDINNSDMSRQNIDMYRYEKKKKKKKEYQHH